MTLEIIKQMEFDAPVETVWHAITNPQELAAWFPDKSADFKAEPGFVGTFEWELDDSDCGGGSFALKVEAAEPFHRLVWSWARESGIGFDEGPTTRVEWNLAERDNGGTVLVLRETGFESLEALEENSGGWDSELGELTQRIRATHTNRSRKLA